MLVGAENASVIYSLACLRRETSSLPDGRWILEETETVARQSERPTVEAAAAALSRSRCQRRTFFVRLLSRDHAQQRTRHSRLAMRDGWRPDPIRVRFRAPAASRSSNFRRIIAIEARPSNRVIARTMRYNEPVTRNRRSSARINKAVEQLPTRPR